MIKKDKEGMYVEVAGEKFYISNIDETVDDLISLINSLRQTEKLANLYFFIRQVTDHLSHPQYRFL